MQVKLTPQGVRVTQLARARAARSTKVNAVLWVAASERADRLQLKLANNGYSVVRVVSGGLTPTLQVDASVLSGYEEIELVALS